MYCQKCGKEIGKDAEFCPGCGTRVSTRFQVSESKQPLLVLKRKFIPLNAVLGQIVFQLLFISWLAAIPASLAGEGIEALELDIPSWFTYVFVYCLFFFGIPIIGYFIEKKNAEKTEYRLWPNKLDYYKGFLAVEEKSIDWRKITEVRLRKGSIQQRYGLGTIVLSTPATGSSGRSTGLELSNIENPDDVFRLVKDLVSKAT